MATTKAQMKQSAESIKDLFDELTALGMQESFAQRVIEQSAPEIIAANTTVHEEDGPGSGCYPWAG